ncbi:enhancer of split m5 protein-like [Stomoxys calcitrans]|uniref:enhancer of split m5 protein-like n=1 Tax=Stomoxys calcitrans TaxID=35570 RepID=UPI0027E2DF57|nr:enhancer of split m5 protein-like [Stomoxys calcitrans]
MTPQMEYVSKTQHYLKVKKPQLERERRARINKSLDQLKHLVAELQGSDAIMQLDKAEMLEAAVAFMKKEVKKPKAAAPLVPMEPFCHGFMNAVNEVSRVMATIPHMNVELGKSVMIHLGSEYNRLTSRTTQQAQVVREEVYSSAPLSPASSGYHSDDCDESSMASPPPKVATAVWRPW